MNKIFCSFILKENISEFTEDLNRKYTILNGKMFVFECNDKEEFIVTYNTEQGSLGGIPKNTILVHKKKDSNTLYTINAMNNLIKVLNNGSLDKNFRINWMDYKDNILLATKTPPGFKKKEIKLNHIIRF